MKAGANPNLPLHLGKFPLHLAIEQNLLPLVLMVDVEAREQDCPPPKVDHLAVDRLLEEMVRYLVKRGLQRAHHPCLCRVLQEPKRLETYYQDHSGLSLCIFYNTIKRYIGFISL